MDQEAVSAAVPPSQFILAGLPCDWPSHQDCVSSEVRLNVDLDTVLKVLTNGCYRWLASQLHGFDQCKPKGVYRKFVETSGAVEIESGHRIVVSLDRRSYNPILRKEKLDKDQPQIPWLGNHRLEFVYS